MPGELRPVGEVGSFSAKTSRCAPQPGSRARLGGTWSSMRGFRPMPYEMKLTRAAVAEWNARISSQGKVRWGSTRSTKSSRKCPGRGRWGHLHDRHMLRRTFDMRSSYHNSRQHSARSFRHRRNYQRSGSGRINSNASSPGSDRRTERSPARTDSRRRLRRQARAPVQVAAVTRVNDPDREPSKG